MWTPIERNIITADASLIATRLLQSNTHCDTINLNDMLVIPEMTNNIDLYAAAGEILAMCVKESPATVSDICADATVKALLKHMDVIHVAAAIEKDMLLLKNAAALAILVLQKNN